MKAVLISIHPKWVELIANGKKTIEVRKTRPKLETPFKCYIYETNWKDNTYWKNKHKGKLGKVIGEFVCDRIDEFRAEFAELEYPALHDNTCLNSIKRVDYWDEENDPECSFVSDNESGNPDDCYLCRESCVSFDKLRGYIGETFYDKSFYGWHISDLKIYD